MRPTVKYLSTACAGAMLFACANVGHRAAPMAPQARAVGSPDDAYVQGRQQHMSNRFPQAIASYQNALQIDPRHVNATNGLATLYAEQGDFAKAIALWKELTDATSASAGPTAAFLFSNLGYAHLLHGDYRQAITALERACLLDPLNYRAWRHLGTSLDRIGQNERAQLMFKQASALEKHDFKSDYALAQRKGVAAIDSAVGAGSTSDGWARTEVRQTGKAMFELRRAAPVAPAPMPVAAVPAAPAAAPLAAAAPLVAAVTAPVAAPPASVPLVETAAVTMPVAAPAVETIEEAPPEEEVAVAEVTRLEIRNGNGVTGMARAMARDMDDPGLRVVRLSNQKGFNVERTRVEYQSAFREVAAKLAERFAGATLQEVESCNTADVRLVIGRDLARSKVEARRIIKAALARAARAG
jgi:Flp pilus assembly protein TadD